MRRRVLALALLAIAVGAIACAWYGVASEGVLEDVSDDAGFVTTVVIVGEIVGFALTVRGANRWVGPIVQVAAVLVPLATVREAEVGALVATASTVWLATLLLPALLLLETPARAGGRVTRTIVAAGGVAAALLARPVVDAAGPLGSPTWWHVLLPRAAPDDARRLFVVHTAVVVVTLGVVAYVVVRHYASMHRAVRPVTRPILFTGLAWIVVTATGQIARLADPVWALTSSRDGLTAPAALLLHIAPLVTWGALLCAIGWVTLVAPLLGQATAGALDPEAAGSAHAFLRHALADPTVSLAYRDADGTWLDRAGRPTTLASDRTERAVTEITRDGTVLGAIETDAATAASSNVVELVGAVAGLAIDTGRLSAIAQANLEHARRLTARLVTSADDARRALQDELEAGPLRELDAIASSSPRDWNDIAGRLEEIASRVRVISHGVFPNALAEHGLAAALSGADVETTRRYASSVEVTAYLAARGDAGTRIYEASDCLCVELGEADVDASVADRVAVLGGAIDGTMITIPVGGPR